jgi:hypothetical protein
MTNAGCWENSNTVLGNSDMREFEISREGCAVLEDRSPYEMSLWNFRWFMAIEVRGPVVA